MSKKVTYIDTGGQSATSVPRPYPAGSLSEYQWQVYSASGLTTFQHYDAAFPGTNYLLIAIQSPSGSTVKMGLYDPTSHTLTGVFSSTLSIGPESAFFTGPTVMLSSTMAAVMAVSDNHSYVVFLERSGSSLTAHINEVPLFSGEPMYYTWLARYDATHAAAWKTSGGPGDAKQLDVWNSGGLVGSTDWSATAINPTNPPTKWIGWGDGRILQANDSNFNPSSTPGFWVWTWASPSSTASLSSITNPFPLDESGEMERGHPVADLGSNQVLMFSTNKASPTRYYMRVATGSTLALGERIVLTAQPVGGVSGIGTPAYSATRNQVAVVVSVASTQPQVWIYSLSALDNPIPVMFATDYFNGPGRIYVVLDDGDDEFIYTFAGFDPGATSKVAYPQLTAIDPGQIPHGTVMTDSSGNGYHGSYYSTAPGINYSQSQTGCVPGDTSAAFDNGAYGFIQDPILDWEGSFTIEYWLLGAGDGGATLNFLLTSGDPPSGINDEVYVFSEGVESLTPGIVIQSTPTGVSYRSTAIPTSIFDATPHHLVVAIDTSVLDEVESLPTPTFYWDGVPIPYSGTHTHIGGGFPPAYIYLGRGIFGGVMDEVALYPHVLSPARVAAHYAAASSSFPAYNTAVLTDNPAAYYHLNEGTGDSGPRGRSVAAPGQQKIIEVQKTHIKGGATSITSTGAPHFPYLP